VPICAKAISFDDLLQFKALNALDELTKLEAGSSPAAGEVEECFSTSGHAAHK
jgi:hypothetical protein